MTKKVKERRITTPNHIRQLMQESINTLRTNPDIEPVQKARAIAYLSTVALTSIEMHTFENRIKAIEEQLEGGK